MKTLNFLILLGNATNRIISGLWTLIQMIFLSGIGLLVVLGTIYLIKGGVHLFEVKSNAWCESKWGSAGLDAKWEAGTGCLVNVDGRWVPEANVQFQPKNSN